MRKVNTIGIHQANKVMLMVATAYNLKKYLKFEARKVKSKAEEVKALLISYCTAIQPQKLIFEALYFHR